jgi:hypothetical protein
MSLRIPQALDGRPGRGVNLAMNHRLMGFAALHRILQGTCQSGFTNHPVGGQGLPDRDIEGA